jgi:hypothetical protein
MSTTQQTTIQNFDLALLDQLRQDANVHCLDMGRVTIVPLGIDGRYSVEFDKPLADIERFCPGAPSQINARSAHQAEGLALLWAKRIQVGERQAVRHGVVCGWDTAKINRTPVSTDELDRYRARLKETELQRRITAELIAAVEERQQEANQNAQDELLARYPQSVRQPRKAKPLPAPTLPGVPTKRTHGSTAK